MSILAMKFGQVLSSNFNYGHSNFKMKNEVVSGSLVVPAII